MTAALRALAASAEGTVGSLDTQVAVSAFRHEGHGIFLTVGRRSRVLTNESSHRDGESQIESQVGVDEYPGVETDENEINRWSITHPN